MSRWTRRSRDGYTKWCRHQRFVNTRVMKIRELNRKYAQPPKKGRKSFYSKKWKLMRFRRSFKLLSRSNTFLLEAKWCRRFFMHMEYLF